MPKRPTPKHVRLSKIRKMMRDGTLPSQRKLAEMFGVSLSTVNGDVAEVRAEENRAQSHGNLFNEDGSPKAGAEIGNDRATTHGANSEKLIAPRAAEIVEVVFRSQPHLDRERDQATVMRYAQTLARIERVYEWLDAQPDPVFAGRGAAHPAYGRLDQWEATASRAEATLGISPLARQNLGLPVSPDTSADKPHDLSSLTDHELRVLEFLERKLIGEDADSPLELGSWSLRWLTSDDEKTYYRLIKRIEQIGVETGSEHPAELGSRALLRLDDEDIRAYFGLLRRIELRRAANWTEHDRSRPDPADSDGGSEPLQLEAPSKVLTA